MLHPTWLLDYLACPYCRVALQEKDGALHCTACARSYAVNEKGRVDVRTDDAMQVAITLDDEPTAPPSRWQQRVKGLKRRARIATYSRGSGVECSLCGWTGSQFLPTGRHQTPNRLCPQCSSLERYRMLHLYLRDFSDIAKQPAAILDVATKPCFRDFCQSLPNVCYVSSDLMTEGAMVFSDLTKMGFQSESFNVLTCLHVMEHIPNDDAAFREIARLLKPNSFALVMVPIRGASTLEVPDADPKDYEELFGQFDHIRYYGLDIAQRMERAGLRVETLDMFSLFDEATLKRYALRGEDRYFFRASRA